MLTDEFAERVAGIIVEKLQERNVLKKPKKIRPHDGFNGTQRKMLNSLRVAIEERGGRVLEMDWRWTHRDMYGIDGSALRIAFSRYRDGLEDDGCIIFDGIGYTLGVTGGASKNVTGVTNAPLP